MINLTLLIPTKYEVESLPTFLKELKDLKCKKLVVIQKNDLETINVVNNFENVEVLIQKNEGYGSALIEGINHIDTEYCCIINADGSMNPLYLDAMLNICSEQDFVFASRYLKPDGGSEDDTIITFIGNKIFSFLGNFIYNLDISDILFTYILGKTKSFKSLHLVYNDFKICVEIPIKAKKQKLNYCSIPSYERTRIGGTKKVNALKDGFLILLAILSFIWRK